MTTSPGQLAARRARMASTAAAGIRSGGCAALRKANSTVEGGQRSLAAKGQVSATVSEGPHIVGRHAIASVSAAYYAGVNIVRNTVLVMMLSGGLAGLAGMAEVTGVVHRLQGAISPGYGFTGIIIAWLAKLNPFAVVLVSVLFGGLIQAGREIQPSGVPRMLQGIILFCVIASDVFLKYRVRLVRR